MRQGAAAALVLWGALALAAPAPLPRTHLPIKHPHDMVGYWKLTWHGRLYHYHFKPDGTFEHVFRTEDEHDYSGKWRLENGRLYMSEQAWCKYDLGLEYGYWMTDSKQVWLSR